KRKISGEVLDFPDVTERTASELARTRLLVSEQAARKEAEAAQQRFAFLAEASDVLASSLDYETTLASVARLAVPRIADWCAIEMADSQGVVRRLATAHVDPSKVELAHELDRRFPPDPSNPYGAPEVIRSGRSQLVEEIPDEVLVASSRGPEHLEILRRLGLRSYICAPLVARGRTLGAITFIAAESGHQRGA